VEDKIVLPAGVSMDSADENWSDISIHQSAMQGPSPVNLLKKSLSRTDTANVRPQYFAYKMGQIVVNFIFLNGQ